MAHSIFQGLGSQTAQEVSGMLGLMASVAPAGAASTASWTPLCQVGSQLHQGPNPLKGPLLVPIERGSRNGLQKEGQTLPT